MNNIQTKDVWITLEQGSLIAQAEIEPIHPAATWPDTQQLMVVIDEARQGATMADRAQRSQAQPSPQTWPNGAAPQEHMDDSHLAHNPQGIGFRLVTGKGLNLTKLFGEQDSKNKISYTKWSRQVRNFV